MKNPVGHQGPKQASFLSMMKASAAGALAFIGGGGGMFALPMTRIVRFTAENLILHPIRSFWLQGGLSRIPSRPPSSRLSSTWWAGAGGAGLTGKHAPACQLSQNPDSIHPKQVQCDTGWDLQF